VQEPLRLRLELAGVPAVERIAHPAQVQQLHAEVQLGPRLVREAGGADAREAAARIGIVGVPARMRTVRSLLLLLSRFAGNLGDIVIITDESEPFAPEQREELEEAGLEIRISDDLDANLPNLDVVYINAIAWKGDAYESLGRRFRLHRGSPFKSGAIVLHPLARGEELDRSLDGTPHNWYFAQARGAVFVRMALLSAMLKTYA